MNARIETLAILKDFHRITGARISLHDLDFKEILCYPENLSPFCSVVQKYDGVKEKCIEADRNAFETVRSSEQAYTYKCHCGLIETVAPIYHYGILSGYFMMGQISDDSDNSIENIKKLSDVFLSETDNSELLYSSIPKLNDDLLNSYINILKVLSEYITQTNRIAPKDRDLAENIKHYINRNYQNSLSLKSLCEVFGCSRTTLINHFRKRYGISVSEYINQYRLDKAAQMLSDSKVMIKIIACSCGFCDQNYFSKAFYKQYGCTPSEYRNNESSIQK